MSPISKNKIQFNETIPTKKAISQAIKYLSFDSNLNKAEWYKYLKIVKTAAYLYLDQRERIEMAITRYNNKLES